MTKSKFGDYVYFYRIELTVWYKQLIHRIKKYLHSRAGNIVFSLFFIAGKHGDLTTAV